MHTKKIALYTQNTLEQYIRTEKYCRCIDDQNITEFSYFLIIPIKKY